MIFCPGSYPRQRDEGCGLQWVISPHVYTLESLVTAPVDFSSSIPVISIIALHLDSRRRERGTREVVVVQSNPDEVM